MAIDLGGATARTAEGLTSFFLTLFLDGFLLCSFLPILLHALRICSFPPRPDFRREVSHPDLADLDGHVVATWALLRPFDRLSAWTSRRSSNSTATSSLPGGPSLTTGLPAGKVTRAPVDGGLQPVHRQHHAGLQQLVVVLVHGTDGFRIRHGIGRGGLISLRDHAIMNAICRAPGLHPLRDDDHPAQAELVAELPKGRREEGLGERHADLTPSLRALKTFWASGLILEL